MIIPIEESWPESDIPLPFVDFNGIFRNATIATSDDQIVLIEKRSRLKTSYDQIYVNWVLTRSQYAAFQHFFLDDLGNGVAKFTIPLRYPKNTELRTWIVRFVAGYQPNEQDGVWTVFANLDLIGENEVN